MKLSLILLILPLFQVLSCGARIDLNGDLDGGAVADSNNGGSGPPPGGVGYQLDATAAEIIALGVSPLTMSNNNQTGSYILTASGSNVVAFAIPRDVFGAPVTIDFSTGIKAFECELNFPEVQALGATDSDMYQVGCGALTLGTLDLAATTIRVQEDGVYLVRVRTTNGQVFESSFTYINLPSRIGVELNSNTSTLKVYFDGAEQILTNSSYAPQSSIMALSVSENTYNVPGNAGLTVSARLITRAADMTTDFSVGAVDPFGDPTP